MRVLHVNRALVRVILNDNEVEENPHDWGIRAVVSESTEREIVFIADADELQELGCKATGRYLTWEAKEVDVSQQQSDFNVDNKNYPVLPPKRCELVLLFSDKWVELNISNCRNCCVCIKSSWRCLRGLIWSCCSWRCNTRFYFWWFFLHIWHLVHVHEKEEEERSETDVY